VQIFVLGANFGVLVHISFSLELECYCHSHSSLSRFVNFHAKCESFSACEKSTFCVQILSG